METMLNGWLALGLGLLLAGAIALLVWAIRREIEGCMVIGGIFSLFLFIFTVAATLEWYMMSNNPTFYAIKKLIGG